MAPIACSRELASHPPIDLLALLPSSERRAGGPIDQFVTVQPLPDAAGTNTTPALLLRAPARVTWRVRIPDRAVLSTDASLLPIADAPLAPGATLRVGISDNRYYENLLSLPLSSAAAPAVPVRIDLAAYGGRKWSLFYRPSTITWQVIVNADATPGGVIALRAPAIGRR